MNEPDFITGMMLLIGAGGIFIGFCGLALLIWKAFTGEDL
jgi:hypothetical protein